MSKTFKSILAGTCIVTCSLYFSKSLIDSTSSNYKHIILENQPMDLQHFFYNKIDNVCEMAFSIAIPEQVEEKGKEKKYITELFADVTNSYQECYASFMEKKNEFERTQGGKKWHVFVNREKDVLSLKEFEELKERDTVKFMFAIILVILINPVLYFTCLKVLT